MASTELDLLAIIATALGVDSDSLTFDTTSDDLAEWDSLAQVGLVAEIEAAIDDRLSPREISRMTSVQNVADILAKRGDASSASA